MNRQSSPVTRGRDFAYRYIDRAYGAGVRGIARAATSTRNFSSLAAFASPVPQASRGVRPLTTSRGEP